MLQDLADKLVLGSLLEALEPFDYEHIDHWQQGEFHHDYVLRLRNTPSELPGPILVVSTNCNAGKNIKQENLRSGTASKPLCQECKNWIAKGLCVSDS